MRQGHTPNLPLGKTGGGPDYNQGCKGCGLEKNKMRTPPLKGRQRTIANIILAILWIALLVDLSGMILKIW
jgi:hypothetical protein